MRFFAMSCFFIPREMLFVYNAFLIFPKSLQRAGFPIVGGHWGAPPPPHPTIFFENPPIKTDAPMGCPLLKNKAPPILKTTPPPRPIKHEAPFYEMIPQKSTTHNNLKSS